MNDTQKRFLDARMILISGEVDSAMARYVEEAIGHFSTLGNPDVDVIIQTNGGDVDIGLHIFDAIDTYRGRTRGVVASFARSMGAVILQACTTREAGKHAKILVHHVSRKNVSLDTLTDPQKLADLAANMARTQEKMYLILEAATGRSREEIIAACLPDADMTADEALVFGLIGKIVESSKKEDRRTK